MGAGSKLTITGRKHAQRLKRAYEHASSKNQESFDFEGHELVTSYAKYLLEYLARKYGKL